MKVRFVKNYLSYKSDQEVEFEAEEAGELIDSGRAVEVKEDATETLLKAVDSKVKEVAEEAYRKGRDEAKADIAKAFGKRAPSIHVGPDRELEKPWRKGEFAMAVKAACINRGEMDVRLKASTASGGSSVGTDADGGFAVPDIWGDSIYDDIVSSSDLFGRCNNIPMSGPGSTLKLPADNTTTLGSNGLTAREKARAEDGTSITPSKMQVREISINVNRLVTLAPVTDDLLADGLALEAYLEGVVKRDMTYRLNENVFRGGSVCTGILGHASTVSVARQTAGHVTFADIKKMWSQRYGRPGSFVWITNQEVEPELMSIADEAGFNLYFAPGSLGMNPSGGLFGAPVLPLDNASGLGAAGDITLVSLENYLTVSKGGLERAVSPHLYFDTAEQAFRWTLRVGGRPARDTVITPATGRGTLTRSPFVTLGAVAA